MLKCGNREAGGGRNRKGEGEKRKAVAWRATHCVTGDKVSGKEASIVATLPGRQYNKGESQKRKAKGGMPIAKS